MLRSRRTPSKDKTNVSPKVKITENESQVKGDKKDSHENTEKTPSDKTKPQAKNRVARARTNSVLLKCIEEKRNRVMKSMKDETKRNPTRRSQKTKSENVPQKNTRLTRKQKLMNKNKEVYNTKLPFDDIPKETSETNVLKESLETTVLKESSETTILKESKKTTVLRKSSETAVQKESSETSVLKESSEPSVPKENSETTVIISKNIHEKQNISQSSTVTNSQSVKTPRKSETIESVATKLKQMKNILGDSVDCLTSKDVNKIPTTILSLMLEAPTKNIIKPKINITKFEPQSMESEQTGDNYSNIKICADNYAMSENSREEEIPRLHISDDEEEPSIANLIKENIHERELNRRGNHFLHKDNSNISKNQDEININSADPKQKFHIHKVLVLNSVEKIDISKLNKREVVEDTNKNDVKSTKTEENDSKKAEEEEEEEQEDDSYELDVDTITENSPNYFSFTHDEAITRTNNIHSYNTEILKKEIQASIFSEVDNKFVKITLSVTPYTELFSLTEKNSDNIEKSDSLLTQSSEEKVKNKTNETEEDIKPKSKSFKIPKLRDRKTTPVKNKVISYFEETETLTNQPKLVKPDTNKNKIVTKKQKTQNGKDTKEKICNSAGEEKQLKVNEHQKTGSPTVTSSEEKIRKQKTQEAKVSVPKKAISLAEYKTKLQEKRKEATEEKEKKCGEEEDSKKEEDDLMNFAVTAKLAKQNKSPHGHK